MADVSGVSSGSYLNSLTGSTTKSNSELSTESFFRLIASELQNQDMSNPMSNSEMMTQMTQIAMMQSMDNFSTAMDDFAQLNTINYGTSMMGKEVMVAYADKKGNIQKLTGTVTRVDIFDGMPTLYLDDDEKTGYAVSNVMSVYEKGHKPPDDIGDEDKDKVENPDKVEDPDKETDPDKVKDPDKETDSDKVNDPDKETDPDKDTEAAGDKGSNT